MSANLKPAKQTAVERFCDGCNCSQAVLTAFAERHAADEAPAIHIASPMKCTPTRSPI